jgi:hypothetical protein
MAQALIGRPGRPPGQSQAVALVRASAAWLRRTGDLLRSRFSEGAGQETGTSQRRLRTGLVGLLDAVGGQPGRVMGCLPGRGR